MFNLYFTEPRKEKTDANTGGNGALSSNAEHQSEGPLLPPPGGGGHCIGGSGSNNIDSLHNKPERPNSLGPGKISRRFVCYHNDHCK